MKWRYLPTLLIVWTLTTGIMALEPERKSGLRVDSLDWQRISKMRSGQGCLHSENAAWLTDFSQRTMSEVNLYGKMNGGDFKNYFTSSSELSFGVDASSICRLSKRVALEGRVGYCNTQHSALAGSAFIDPTQTPFDIVEFTDENRGDKKTEQYSLLGRVGVDVSQRIALGASFSYVAANYAKYKDLRHTNSLMAMDLTLGTLFRLGKGVSVGLDYAYTRRIESISFNTYGTQDKAYASLLNYGAFFGKKEVFGDMGYTKSGETKPLLDVYHGGAIQLSWEITENLRWFNEAGFRTRNGYYGNPSQSTVMYAEHGGMEYYYKSVLNTIHLLNRHNVFFDLRHYGVSTQENVYAFRNEETGLDYIEYLGQREVGNRKLTTFSLAYEGFFHERNGIAQWQSCARMYYNNRAIHASNYPDYRKQNLNWWSIEASATRNIVNKEKNCYSLSLLALYGGGAGKPYNDGKYVQTADGGALTYMRNDLLYQEWEYLTATQIGYGAAIEYSRHLGKAILNVALSGNVRHAFNTQYLTNPMRYELALNIGCRF
ncbi:MAG: hypothetical protein IKU79_00570 [Bacteroidaceae bacterium]|nr:hypothetical protein [Bacteroidaceae bacterium]